MISVQRFFQIILVYLTLFLATDLCLGLPLDTPRSRALPENSQSDDIRTVQSIVWSCTATIFACTWVAIHPNIPDSRCSKWSQFKHRILMMVLTIFAPEFILIWALRQRLGAQAIMKEYNSSILEMDTEEKSLFHDISDWFRKPPNLRHCQQWTLTHGFYVQMGGFLFHDKATEWPIRVLSFPDLLDLIKSGLIEPPMISEEEICDKSKGDFFAKLFVVIQTTWFMTQCIVRWIVKLPISDLEVATFSFAALNIITYTLWIKKPQNVTVGTVIQMKSRAGVVAVPETTGELDIADIQPAELEFPPRAFAGDVSAGTRVENCDHFDHGAVQSNPVQTDSTSPHGKSSHLLAYEKTLAAISIFPRTLSLVGKGILGAELFNQFRKVVLGCRPAIRTTISTQTLRKEPSSEETVVSVIPGPLKVGTFHAHDGPESIGRGKLVLFVVASGLLFGGLHLVPWKFTFPTRTESLIWRVSALYMILNPILLSFPLVLFAVLKYNSSINSKFRSTLIRCLPWVTPPIRIITIAIPLYILARLCIIVLMFTTLRSLHPDVYKDIPWNSYIPHI